MGNKDTSVHLIPGARDNVPEHCFVGGTWMNKLINDSHCSLPHPPLPLQLPLPYRYLLPPPTHMHEGIHTHAGTHMHMQAWKFLQNDIFSGNKFTMQFLETVAPGPYTHPSSSIFI